MQLNTLLKTALPLVTGMLLVRFPEYIAVLVQGEVPVTKMTGLLVCLFFIGTFWTSWLPAHLVRLVALISSTISVLGLFWGAYFTELSETWIFLLSFCVGNSFGVLFFKALTSDHHNPRFKTIYLMGIGLGLGISAIPGIKPHEALILALLILLSQVLVWVLKEEEVYERSQDSNRYTILLSVTYWGLILFELIFWTWSIVLSAGEAHARPLNLVLVAVSLLLFRLLARTVSDRLANPAYMFALALVLMFSVGTVYTLSNPIWFALFFGLSAGILPSLAERFAQIKADQKVIRLLGIMLSVSALIMGFYLENHFEYIQILGLPRQVWLLSAQQAWIKEAATPTGILVLIIGYLYLFRYRWWQRKVSEV